jgi:predicted regulator of Ras-like GTPase activity (Roadblock/LC7/MglB family)
MTDERGLGDFFISDLDDSEVAMTPGGIIVPPSQQDDVPEEVADFQAEERRADGDSGADEEPPDADEEPPDADEDAAAGLEGAPAEFESDAPVEAEEPAAAGTEDEGPASAEPFTPIELSAVPEVSPAEPESAVVEDTSCAVVADEPADAFAAEASAESDEGTREAHLARALDALMSESREIEAAALVSLDGFLMGSALPAGMQEDRVGAMSAAILGLGERAAAELGRGTLSQVFIDGEDGFVVLMAAGGQAVLTCLAGERGKLGLVLYDMRQTAAEIAEILG